MPERDIEAAAAWLYHFDTRRRRGVIYVRWEEIPERTRREFRRYASQLLEGTQAFREYRGRHEAVRPRREVWEPPKVAGGVG